jgi:hypothetical protein
VRSPWLACRSYGSGSRSSSQLRQRVAILVAAEQRARQVITQADLPPSPEIAAATGQQTAPSIQDMIEALSTQVYRQIPDLNQQAIANHRRHSRRHAGQLAVAVPDAGRAESTLRAHRPGHHRVH